MRRLWLRYQFELKLLNRLKWKNSLPVGARHEDRRFRVVCSVNHVVHYGAAIFSFKNGPCLDRLISKVFLKAKDQSVPSLFAGHARQLGPVLPTPPPSKDLAIFLGGKRSLKPSICEKIKYLDLVTQSFIARKLLDSRPVTFEGALIE